MNEKPYMLIYGQSWLFPKSLMKTESRSYEDCEYSTDELGVRVVQDPEIRVLRGGSWINIPELLRIEVRDLDGIWINYSGFRVVCDE